VAWSRWLCHIFGLNRPTRSIPGVPRWSPLLPWDAGTLPQWLLPRLSTQLVRTRTSFPWTQQMGLSLPSFSLRESARLLQSQAAEVDSHTPGRPDLPSSESRHQCFSAGPLSDESDHHG